MWQCSLTLELIGTVAQNVWINNGPTAMSICVKAISAHGATIMEQTAMAHAFSTSRHYEL